MTQFLLFSTSGCHLCEQAELMLSDFGVPIEIIDIAEQTQWQPQYAVRIPVLYNPQTRQELDWPFDAAMVKALLLGV